MSQGGAAQLSYAYDALGRRISKTVQGGTPTQYLYDRANAVQETQGSTINPILTGLAIDERFARNDVSGRTYFLADLLNSTIALTNPTGAIKQKYSYDPYGNVTASDTTTGFTNPYQFTGREADAPGLYYYRARYYSPVFPGFISEDPITFAGRQLSFYAYVGGNPINRRDPLGLWSFTFSAYDGVGGAIVFGQDNATGQWFWGGRLGVGIGGGWNIDPNGSRPGASQTTPCHSTTVGTFAEVASTVSVFGQNPIEAEGGIDVNTGETYSQGPIPDDYEPQFASPANVDVGISFGIEVIGH